MRVDTIGLGIARGVIATFSKASAARNRVTKPANNEPRATLCKLSWSAPPGACMHRHLTVPADSFMQSYQSRQAL